MWEGWVARRCEFSGGLAESKWRRTCVNILMAVTNHKDSLPNLWKSEGFARWPLFLFRSLCPSDPRTQLSSVAVLNLLRVFAIKRYAYMREHTVVIWKAADVFLWFCVNQIQNRKCEGTNAAQRICAGGFIWMISPRVFALLSCRVLCVMWIRLDLHSQSHVRSKLQHMAACAITHGGINSL